MIYNLDGIIRVKMFGHVPQKHGAWHNGSKSNDHTIVYCTQGEINMDVEGTVFHLDAGDLLLIPHKTPYKPLAGNSCWYYFFNFEAEVLPDTTQIPSYINTFPHPWLEEGHAYSYTDTYSSALNVSQFIKNAPYHIRNIFDSADTLHPNLCFTDQLRLDYLLRELLIHMSNDNSQKINFRLSEIINYIHYHYPHPLTLSILSKEFSLSESYIARLFKKELGCTVSEYVNKTRVLVAKTFLLETTMSVAQIAEKTGYTDIYYFSKVFKRIVGISPSKIRQ